MQLKNLIIGLVFLICAISSCKQENPNSSNNSHVQDNKSGSLDPKMHFSLLPAEATGVAFKNQLTEDINFNMLLFHYIYNGGGVAAGDINNDGLTDIYFTGNQVDDHLYLNKGNFKFEDISRSSGILDLPHGWHTGVNMVDINNDGYLDIYICRGANETNDSLRKNLLFVNQKNNTFKEEAGKYGIDDPGFSIHSIFFDFDNDNDLDLFVSDRPDEFSLSVFDILEGRKNGKKENKSRLYRNNGNLTFTDVSEEMGFGESFGYGLGCSVADLNNDGFQDIYVANDFTENDYCWMNQGGKKFSQDIRKITNHTSFYSMGTDIADINNDGLEDIMTVEMLPDDYWRAKVSMSPMVRGAQWDEFFTSGRVHLQYMQNVLNINRGNGFFSDVAPFAGIKGTDWSWAVLMSDFDNDGLRDIYVSNGYRRDVFDNDAMKKADEHLGRLIANNKTGKKLAPDLSLLKEYPEIKLVDYVFKNEGNLKFTKKMTEWGITMPTWSNGAITADLDNDGDLDVVINALDDKALVYKNELSKPVNYLRVKLDGPANNKFGLGAKVEVIAGDKKWVEQFKVIRGYQSSVEPILHFGLADVNKLDEIKVIWTDGNQSSLKDVKANQLVTVSYEKHETIANTKQESPKTLFREITDELMKEIFVHKENVYNDFQIQVLLPHRLSRPGPAVCVGDINGDGLDDFYVGGAMNQSGQIYIQNANGEFNKKQCPVFEKDKLYDDADALFFDADGDKDLDLYVVSGGTEKPVNYDYYQNRIYINNGKGDFTKSTALPKIGISGSCVKPIDFDGDGDLDLFIGGRVVPNYYPLPPNSFILKNDKGKFTDVTTEVAPCLTKLGMVTDALVTDLNKDSKPDLVLVGEWMPITFIIQKDNKFQKDTTDYKIDGPNIGWWNRIIEADINHDGEKDFVVGNIGLNYKFQANEEHPFEVYSADFDGNSTFDVFLAKHLKDRMVPIRGRQCSSEQLPDVVNRFPTYRDFATANLEDILGKDKIPGSYHLRANEFANCFFIRKGNSFTKKVMPLELQFAPVKGIIWQDYDGDGKSDLLMAGNWYESEYETPIADEGIGNFLKNNGNDFDVVPVTKSGFFVPYNVRNLIPIKIRNRNAVLVPANNDKLRIFSVN